MIPRVSTSKHQQLTVDRLSWTTDRRESPDGAIVKSSKSLFRDAGSIRGYALLILEVNPFGCRQFGRGHLDHCGRSFEAEGCQPFFLDGKPRPRSHSHGWAALLIRGGFYLSRYPMADFQVLSDDGGRRRGEKDCGNLDTPSAMGFGALFAY